MKIKFLQLALLLLLPGLLVAQGRKELRENKVVRQTVYEYFIAEGLKDPVVEVIETYDERGNIVEFKQFNKVGEIKLWQQFKYDSDDNKIEESILDAKGKQSERFVWIYKDGFVIEKQYFDQKDRLVKRKEYKYEKRKE